MAQKKKEYKIHPDVRIGYIHLSVSDLQKSLYFYNEILGFEITHEWQGAVFLSAGDYHHHIGLNTWNSPNARKPHEGQIGLYHFAILFPNRMELAKTLKRLIDAKYAIGGFSDHGVSEAIYLIDPDGNGIELYVDKPKSKWPKDSKGKLVMLSKILDVQGLLEEADKK